MRFDGNKSEFEAVLNRLEGMVLKTEQKTIDHVVMRLRYQLRGGTPRPNGYAPIRSARVDNFIKPDRKRNWAYKKPHKPTTPKPPKVDLSADQIIAGL